jgi:hypothetical protein
LQFNDRPTNGHVASAARNNATATRNTMENGGNDDLDIDDI